MTMIVKVASFDCEVDTTNLLYGFNSIDLFLRFKPSLSRISDCDIYQSIKIKNRIQLHK